MSPRQLKPTDRIKKGPFVELDIFKVKEESIDDREASALGAVTVTHMRDNVSQQISNDGLGLTGTMGSFKNYNYNYIQEE